MFHLLAQKEQRTFIKRQHLLNFFFIFCFGGLLRLSVGSFQQVSEQVLFQIFQKYQKRNKTNQFSFNIPVSISFLTFSCFILKVPFFCPRVTLFSNFQQMRGRLKFGVVIWRVYYITHYNVASMFKENNQNLIKNELF